MDRNQTTRPVDEHAESERVDRAEPIRSAEQGQMPPAYRNTGYGPVAGLGASAGGFKNQTEGSWVTPTRPALFDRLVLTVEKGQASQARYERAQRALFLAKRFPEVAELVELLREF